MKDDRYRYLYKTLIRIPAGRVSTYKEVAAASGVKSARAAGNIISRNPRMVEIPCHRVLRSDGRLGGYSGRGGREGKKKLLESEGLVIRNGKVENFKEKFYGLKHG